MKYLANAEYTSSCKENPDHRGFVILDRLTVSAPESDHRYPGTVVQCRASPANEYTASEKGILQHVPQLHSYSTKYSTAAELPSTVAL